MTSPGIRRGAELGPTSAAAAPSPLGVYADLNWIKKNAVQNSASCAARVLVVTDPSRRAGVVSWASAGCVQWHCHVARAVPGSYGAARTTPRVVRAAATGCIGSAYRKAAVIRADRSARTGW